MGDTSRNAAGGRFHACAWTVLGYNILVILWGAVVRATGSGAGCGEHWPLCQGVVIPHAAEIATFIEFAHRVSSGVAVVLVVALVLVAFRRFPEGQPVRRYAVASMVFTFMEGLLGAALVLFGETGSNASIRRVSILSLHSANTFLLLASLALTAWSAREEKTPGRGQGVASHAATPGYGAYGAALIGTLALVVTGTIAALADTLFHPATPLQGFEWDFSGKTNPLLHLRIIHPALAVVVGGYLLILAVRTIHNPGSPSGGRMARALLFLVSLQFCFGALNVLLLTPVWMQALHLLVADLIWVTLVLLSAEALLHQRALLAETGGLRGAQAGTNAIERLSAAR